MYVLSVYYVEGFPEAFDFTLENFGGLTFLSLPRNMGLAPFGKLLIVFSAKANMIYDL